MKFFVVAALIAAVASVASAQSYYGAVIGKNAGYNREAVYMCTSSITSNNICMKTSRGNFVFKCNSNTVDVYKCSVMSSNGQCSSCTMKDTFRVGQSALGAFDYRAYNLTRIFVSTITTGVKQKRWSSFSSSNCSTAFNSPRYVDWWPSSTSTCLPDVSGWSQSRKYYCSAGTPYYSYYSSSTGCTGSVSTNSYIVNNCYSSSTKSWSCWTLSGAKAFGLVASAGHVYAAAVSAVAAILAVVSML